MKPIICMFSVMLAASAGLFGAEPEPVVVQGARVTVSQLDTWLPILDARGRQRKAIVPDSDDGLADGDRPIVIDRGPDYLIDYPNGRFKALPAGRIVRGWVISLSFKTIDRGPTPITVDDQAGWQFDGHDDTLAVPFRAADRPPWSNAELACRLKLGNEVAPDAIILGAPKRFLLSLRGHRLTLSVPRRGATDIVLSAPEPLPRGKWLAIRATLADDRLRLHVNGVEVASTAAAGLTIAGPLRIQAGGKQDPTFLTGQMMAIHVSAKR